MVGWSTQILWTLRLWSLPSVGSLGLFTNCARSLPSEHTAKEHFPASLKLGIVVRVMWPLPRGSLEEPMYWYYLHNSPLPANCGRTHWDAVSNSRGSKRPPEMELSCWPSSDIQYDRNKPLLTQASGMWGSFVMTAQFIPLDANIFFTDRVKRINSTGSQFFRRIAFCMCMPKTLLFYTSTALLCLGSRYIFKPVPYPLDSHCLTSETQNTHTSG